jgi:DNA-binding CsgD family transcriptional regulator/tetratricopeptide (TPR) repeat protein
LPRVLTARALRVAQPPGPSSSPAANAVTRRIAARSGGVVDIGRPLDNGSMVTRVSSPLFVGRSDQLERVVEALRRARDDDPTFILVAGDAGVGKTRFVEEVARRAEGLGGRALVGGCVQMGEDKLPYAPIVEALRRLSQDVSPADLASLIGPGSSDLTRLVPDFAVNPPKGETPSDEASTSHQGRLFEVLLGVFRRLAADRPLLLVIEDIHWADASTVALLDYLTRNLSGAIVLVATYRSDELHRRHPLLPFLAEVERRRHIERIDLPPFDRGEIAELVREIRSEPADRHLIDQLFERSDGNAFYIEELLATRATIGELPTTLREVLSARVAELTEPTQELLRHASAAGPDISAPVLGAVSQIDEAQVHARLREAVERHILTTHAGSDRLTFRHALMREAIYESLLPWERTRLHAAFAAALEVTPSDAGDPSRAAELAYHWYAAHDLSRALEAAVRAAKAFDRVLAPADAHAQYERALELWDRVPDPARLVGLERVELLERAAAAAAVSTPSRAVALMNATIELVDPEADPTRAGQLWELLGRYLWASGDSPAAAEACRTAAKLVPVAPPSVARAQILASLGRMLMNDARFREARLVLEEAATLARATGADAVEGYALNSLGLALGYLGNAEAGREKLRGSREIGARLGNREEVARADANIIDLMVHVAGRFEEAAALAREAFAYDQEHQLAHIYGVYNLCEGAGALIRAGQWVEADELLERAKGYESSGMPEIFLNERLALLEVGRGQDQPAAERIALLRRLMGGSTDSQWTLPLVELSAELALWQRRPDDARHEIAEALDRLGTLDPGNISRIGPVIALALRADADQAELARSHRSDGELDDIRRAASRYMDLIRAIHDEIVHERPSQIPLVKAYLPLCEAEVGRLEGELAPDRWSRAAAAFGGLSMPYQQAYARWREADAQLAARGHRAAANDALVEAHGIATRLGAEPLGREIEATAQRARIDLTDGQRATARGPKPGALFGLTARELEVLELVVAGRTNREIADQLFISENTAGVHVSNILGKLGVSRRMEAAAIAHRLGIIKGKTGD